MRFSTLAATACAAVLAIVATPLVVSHFGTNVQRCAGSAPYNMCEGDVRVGLDLRGATTPVYVRHDLTQPQQDGDTHEMWVEGASKDAVILHGVQKQYVEGNYTVFTGTGTSLKVSSAVQVKIVESN